MAQKQIPGIETTLDRDDVKSSEDYRIVRDTSTGSDVKTAAGSAGGYDVGTDNDEISDNASACRVEEIDVAGDSDVTLSESQATARTLRLTGELEDDIDLIVPDTERVYQVINEAAGGYSITIRTDAGTGITIEKGTGGGVWLRSDGDDVVRMTGTADDEIPTNKILGTARDSRFHSFPVWPRSVMHGLCYNQKPPAIYDDETDRTFFTFSGPGWGPHVGFYDHEGQYIEGPEKVDDYPIDEDDDHGKPVIIIDNDGYLHVFYGTHNSPLYHAKSDSPKDITSWTIQEVTDLPDMTYSNAALDTDTGDLYLFFRAGENTHDGTYPGHEYGSLARSTDGGDTWTDLGPQIDLTGTSEDTADVYPIGALIYRNEKLYMTWILAEGESHDDVRKNVYCAYYDITDEKMYSVDGTDLGETITYSELSDCEVRSADNTNNPSMRIRSNGDIYISWPELSSDESEVTAYVARWNGSSWEVENSNAKMSALFNMCDIYLDEENDTIELFVTTNDVNLDDPRENLDYEVRGGNIDVYTSDIETLDFSFKQRIADKRNSNGIGFAFPSVPFNADKKLKIFYGTGSASPTEFTLPIYAATDNPADALRISDILTRIPNTRTEHFLIGERAFDSSDDVIPDSYQEVDLSDFIPENATHVLLSVFIKYDADKTGNAFFEFQARRKGSRDDFHVIKKGIVTEVGDLSSLTDNAFESICPASWDRKIEFRLKEHENIMYIHFYISGWVVQ